MSKLLSYIKHNKNKCNNKSSINNDKNNIKGFTLSETVFSLAIVVVAGTVVAGTTYLIIDNVKSNVLYSSINDIYNSIKILSSDSSVRNKDNTSSSYVTLYKNGLKVNDINTLNKELDALTHNNYKISIIEPNEDTIYMDYIVLNNYDKSSMLYGSITYYSHLISYRCATMDLLTSNISVSPSRTVAGGDIHIII